MWPTHRRGGKTAEDWQGSGALDAGKQVSRGEGASSWLSSPPSIGFLGLGSLLCPLCGTMTLINQTLPWPRGPGL